MVLPKEPVASPAVVAWRTRHLVGIMLAAGLVLLGLTWLAEQSGPNAVDLTATLWLQFQSALVRNVDVRGELVPVRPESWVRLSSPRRLRRGLWLEALWLLGTQVASAIDSALKQVVGRARPSPDLVGVVATLNDPSFPSGHVVQYTALFGCAFFLVYGLAPPKLLVGRADRAGPVALTWTTGLATSRLRRTFLGYCWA